MTHKEAETSGAAERYLLDEMTEPEQAAFEEHYFECPECAEEIRTAKLFLANLRAVYEERKSPAVLPVRPPVRRLRWPQVAGLAAALLVATVLGYQNLVEIPHLRHNLETAGGVDSPPTFYLAETRSVEDVLTLPAGATHFSLLLNQKPGRIYPYYDCVLSAENGTVVRAFRVPVPLSREEWQLRLPAEGLTSQAYVLRVRGAETAGGADLRDVGEFHFRLEFR